MELCRIFGDVVENNLFIRFGTKYVYVMYFFLSVLFYLISSEEPQKQTKGTNASLLNYIMNYKSICFVYNYF